MKKSKFLLPFPMRGFETLNSRTICINFSKNHILGKNYERMNNLWEKTTFGPNVISSFFTGMSDKIRFITDRRIYVVGFGLYGSIHGPCEYQVTIQVKNFCFFWLTCSSKLYITSIINAQMNLVNTFAVFGPIWPSGQYCIFLQLW